jgi:hypothetical protein
VHNGAFQLNKARRAIRTQGRPFDVVRYTTNKFNEPTQQTGPFGFIGILHDTTRFTAKSVNDASTIQQRSYAPMILTLWEDAKEIQPKDLIKFNGKSYRIAEVRNVAEANLVADISLEEVQT